MLVRRTMSAVAIVALAAGFGAGSPSLAKVSTYNKTYLPANPVYGMCEIEPIGHEAAPGGPAWGQNIGVVCLSVPGSKKEARIVSIIDDGFASADFSWYWLDKNWNPVGKPDLADDPEENLLGASQHRGDGCYTVGQNAAATPWLKKPKGGKYFYVFIHDAAIATAFPACSNADGGAAGGKVKLQLR
ncbi:MAG TPA: hypothetical protein VGB83_11215 [Actinomycetota bacterium]